MKVFTILRLSLAVIFSVGDYRRHDHHVFRRGQPVRRWNDARPGLSQRNILAAFLAESLVLGIIGGLTGLFFASFMQFITVSTVNFQNFSELAFQFTLTGPIVLQSMVFAIVMGLIGGMLPALRASRMQIVEALRAA